MAATLFTIGYTSYPVDDLVAVLGRHTVGAVADVRSMPFSAVHPEYNRGRIKERLAAGGIAYVFLGDLLGARYDDPEVYVGKVVSYDKVSRTETFRRGLSRLRAGLEKYPVALMCAEKDPITCHRMILICRYLRADCRIAHILSEGRIEPQAHAELRLMRLFDLDRPDLLGRTEEERLELAYRTQEKEIAYTCDAREDASAVECANE